MLRGMQKVVWEDAYSVIEPQINASGVHVWRFDESFPVDVRHFILRREADIRLNHHGYFELLYLQSGEVTYDVAGERHPMKPGDLFVIGDDLLGQHQVGLQQGLRGPLHGDPGQPAHLAEPLGQFRELLMVGGPHVLKTTFSRPRRSTDARNG